MWDLVIKAAGQLRDRAGVPAGFDMAAFFALAGPLGVDAILLAQTLPAIERAAMGALNGRSDDASSGFVTLQ